MTKRVFALLLSFLLLCSPITAFAQTKESTHIRIATASLRQDDAVSKIEISYNVYGRSTMSVIGVSKIVVYNADGTYYKTITGSTSNTLLKTNASSATGTYETGCVPGNAYYCVVYCYARDSSGSETKTYTTGVAIARPLDDPGNEIA